MRKSLASFVGNLGNTVGISTPLRKISNELNKSSGLENGSRGDTNSKFSARNAIYTSPSRPLGLPPPLPFNRERSNMDVNAFENNIDGSLKNSPSVENTRILTPFKANTLVRSQNNENSIATKSVVKIKSIGQTPKRTETNMFGSNNLQTVPSIFTPISSNRRYELPSLLEKTPNNNVNCELFEENNENMNLITYSNKTQFLNSNLSGTFGIDTPKITESSKAASSDNNDIQELRKRLNEKNQEIHFLRRTVRDLEGKISNLENKEKVMIKEEINNKKMLDELIVEKQNYIEKIRVIQEQVLKIQQEKANLIEDNAFLSNENGSKTIEIKKLNEEIINLENMYKNNFTIKYLNPIKNLLYEFITEIKGQVGKKALINVDFSSSDNIEIDILIRTLHEYVNHLKNAIKTKMDEDKYIIDKLHDEMNKINCENYELKQIIQDNKNQSTTAGDCINVNSVDKSNNSDVHNSHIDSITDNHDFNENNDLKKAKARKRGREENSSRTSIVNFGFKDLAKSLISYTCSITNSDSKKEENDTVSQEIKGKKKIRTSKSKTDDSNKKVRKVIQKKQDKQTTSKNKGQVETKRKVTDDKSKQNKESSKGDNTKKKLKNEVTTAEKNSVKQKSTALSKLKGSQTKAKKVSTSTRKKANNTRSKG